MNYRQWRDNLIIVRGGGDIATGTIHKLFQCGFPVLVLEMKNPSCIRRTVSFCEAVFDREMVVEGVTAVRVESLEEAFAAWKEGRVPVRIDPEGTVIRQCFPAVVVDAILAKKNLGTSMQDAPIVIALGPGFTAGKDVHAVIETKRGHNLGRVIYKGEAASNTGVPGVIGGYGKERVIHAPIGGKVHIVKKIGEETAAGDIIAYVDTEPVFAGIMGIVRGMIREGYQVEKGLKMADIDPRTGEKQNCLLISDKARCVAGGVLEAIMHLKKQIGRHERGRS